MKTIRQLRAMALLLLLTVAASTTTAVAAQGEQSTCLFDPFSKYLHYVSRKHVAIGGNSLLVDAIRVYSGSRHSLTNSTRFS